MRIQNNEKPSHRSHDRFHTRQYPGIDVQTLFFSSGSDKKHLVTHEIQLGEILHPLCR